MLVVRHGGAPGRRWAGLGLVIGVLLGVAACTSGESTPVPPPARTTVERVWTAAGVDPVSAVVDVDGVAVVYGTVGNGLMIYGLDPATGAQLWTRPAIPTVVADQVDLTPVDGSVAYFRPIGADRAAQLVLADPHTGADLTVSAARYWRGTPVLCADDRQWVCLASMVQISDGEWDRREFRVERSTGRTAPRDGSLPPTPAGTYSLASDDLTFDYRQDHRTISSQQHGSPSWSRPIRDLFGAGATSISTFTRNDSADGSFAVMTLTGSAGETSGQPFDLATGVVTAAFNLADGSSRWISQGSALGCLGGSVPLRWDSSSAMVFRCRYTGSAVRTIAGLRQSQFVTSNLGVTLERFDPASGQVLWTAELGEARTLAADSSASLADAVLDDTRLFVPNSAGGLVIDLDSGKTRSPEASDVLWCNDDRSYPRAVPYYTDDSRPVTTALRNGVVRPCHSDGTDAAQPTTGLPEAVSAGFGDELRVVALAGGVSGFLVPPRQPAAVDSSQATGSGSSSGSSTAAGSSQTAASPSAPAAPEPTAAAGTGNPVTAIEQAWSATGFEPLTAVTLVGDTAVLYGTVSSDLFLIGLDPVTGAERWRQRAWAGGFYPTTKIAVREIDGALEYLRPTDDRTENTHLVLADPATGADLLVTENRWWTGFPTICADDAAYLCGWSYASQDNLFKARATRVERSTGAVTVTPDGVPQVPTTSLSGDVVQVNGAPSETIGVLRDGALLWSAATADLLGPAASLDSGWAIGLRPGNPPLVYLSATVNWQSDETRFPALDLATNQATVAVNHDTGQVIWRDSGTWTLCRGLLGDDLARLSTPGSSFPVLRCRYTGRLDSAPPGGDRELTVTTDLTVALERVDLTTGQAIWSVPLGAQASLAEDSPGIAMTHLDDHRLLIGDAVVDLDAGTVRPPAPDEVFWCPARQTLHQSIVTATRGGNRNDRAAGGEVYRCDATARPTAAAPTAVPLAVSAMTAAGLRLVCTPDGVIAYRVPL